MKKSIRDKTYILTSTFRRIIRNYRFWRISTKGWRVRTICIRMCWPPRDVEIFKYSRLQ